MGLPLCPGLVVFGRVEGLFSLIAMLVLISMIADESLQGGYERARDHQEVMVEHTHQIQESVEAWHDFAGLDAGDMHLRQAGAPTQLGLAPAAFAPRLFQLVAHVCGKAIQPHRFDRLLYILSHALYNKTYFCAFQVYRRNYIDQDNKYNITYRAENGDLLSSPHQTDFNVR